MPEYEIMRWDAVIPKNNTFPYPMVYIKPDKDFAEYIEKNKYMFLVDISGTGMDYDQRSVVGMSYSSGYFPDYRPNFFNETGYYVIVLFTNWIGYPESNGKLKLQGSNNLTNIPPPEFTVPKPMDPEFYQSTTEKEKKSCDKLSSSQIGLMLICVLVIFGVLLWISFRKK